MTKGYVDLLFYVSSLNDRINSADERIIKAITSEFKPQVWEHTVLVLTHADNHCRDAEYVKYTDEFAEVFQMYVTKQKGCRNICVKCIQERTEEVSVSDNPYEIAAIPTGLYKDAEPSGWCPIFRGKYSTFQLHAHSIIGTSNYLTPFIPNYGKESPIFG